MTDLWGLLGTRTGRRTPTTPQMAVKMATGRTEAPMMICSLVEVNQAIKAWSF